MRKHPGSFPQANLPTLFNVVKRCRAAAQTMPAGTCFEYPLSSLCASSSSSASPSPSPSVAPNPSNPTGNPRESSLLYHNEHALVVSDPFFKSRLHCLVLPWDTRLKSLNDLDASHVPLLLEMRRAGEAYAAHLRATGAGTCNPTSNAGGSADARSLRTIMGFHAIPSLPMLHMHLISLDLESDKLKKKQHYNSFATYFFLPVDAVLDDLRQNKSVTINQDVAALGAMVDGPMRCLWCNLPLANMPEMRRHVPSCPKNMSREA